MAKLTEQDFKKELSSGKLKNLYLIYGEEKYLVKKYTEKLVEKAAGKEPSGFDFTRLDQSSDLEEIFSACEQLPIMMPKKCVLVTDYNIDSLPDSDLKLLISWCADPSPATVLIFSMPTLTQDSKKSTDKKAGKLQKFASAVEKYGSVIELQKLGDNALEKQLIGWAVKEGCTLSQRNASRIISLCGTDMTFLRNEIDKLCAYANGGEITEDIIQLLAVKNTEVRIFSLSDCISNNDYNGAYKHLYGLFEQNEKPEVILSVLSSVYIDMYRARVAAESGKTIREAAADFNYGRREFLLKNASSKASRYSTKALRDILDIILQADIKIKSTPADKQTVLETLIAGLLLESR